jgi:hypothetical protein
VKIAIPENLQFNDCQHLRIFRGYHQEVFDLAIDIDEPYNDVLLLSRKTSEIENALRSRKFFKNEFLNSFLILLEPENLTAELWSSTKLIRTFKLKSAKVRSKLDSSLKYAYLDVVLGQNRLRIFVAPPGVHNAIHLAGIKELLNCKSSPSYGVLVGATIELRMTKGRQKKRGLDVCPIAVWHQQKGLSHFVPCGGPVDLQMNMQSYLGDEIQWCDWSKFEKSDLGRPDWWSLLTFLNFSKVNDWFQKINGQVSIEKFNPEVAMTLVVMRRVLGDAVGIEFRLDKKPNPQWKRLIEHLGWRMKVAINDHPYCDMPELTLPETELILEIIKRDATTSGLFPRSLF